MGFKYFFFAILVTFSFNSVCEEADEFIKSDLPPPFNENVNYLINQELEYFRDRFNSDSKASCERKSLVNRILERLNGNMTKIGERLKLLAQNKNTSQYFRTPTGATIYSGIEEVQFCCISTLNISGVSIGIDKIDHFFGNSGMLWREWENFEPKDRNISKILQMANNQEEGVWGLSMTGIKSYGDLGANWSGFKFYQQLIDGPNPYFICENNKLKLKRQFKIEDYFNKTWTETVNCSAFKTRKAALIFIENLKHRGMTCPASKADCDEILDLLHSEPLVQREIISPTCFKGRKLEDSVEPPRTIEWTELTSAIAETGIGGALNYIMDIRSRGSK